MKQKKQHIKSERGAVIKNHKNRLKVALIYPNTYQIGMSNLGFQTVYKMINNFDHILCERVFLCKNRTIESGRKISNFDIIAFSVSFETDYPNIYKILTEAEIPAFAKKREDNFPLIIAGGVACLLNPESIAPFIDAFLIGEAEELIPDFFKKIDRIGRLKSNLAWLARNIKGFYVPKFYSFAYNSKGEIYKRETIADIPETIERVFAKNLALQEPAQTSVLTPNTTFANTYLIEAERGCPYKCRFCAIGYIYGQPRYIRPDILKKTIKKASEWTRNIGLIGANISDIPSINKICEYTAANNIRLSFSSLRANSLTDRLAEALVTNLVKTATIAPDAGSERMRKIISKKLTEQDILNAAELLVKKGIPNLRLYFMIGLPFETDEDTDEIIKLSAKIKKVFLEASRKQKKIGKIAISLNPFVPKPFTPFQWTNQDGINNLKKKKNYIIKSLESMPNVVVRAESPKNSYIQTILSNGDRKVANIIELAYKNAGNWTKTLKQTKDITEYYTDKKKSEEQIFPWDFIDHKIKKDKLFKEYKKSAA
ncbi:MAG: radical SAM protein [Deltaproteobacteria bacterium]|nr:radical SAM protein [Deltaproteobacteria bacterium]